MGTTIASLHGPEFLFEVDDPLCLSAYVVARHRGGVECEVIDENEHAWPVAGIVDEVLNEPDQSIAAGWAGCRDGDVLG